MSAFIRRRELPSGAVRYYVNATVNGKQRGRGGFKLKKDAEARLRKVREEIASGTQDAPVSTFAEYSEKWMADYVKPNVRQKTARDYEAIIRVHLVPAFGDKLLTEIRPADVQQFLADQSRREISPAKDDEPARILAPSSANKHLVILKGMLVRAVEWGYLRESPARFVKKLREPHVEMDFYGPEEVQRLLEACTAGNRLLFATAVFCGLRQGELLGLQWGDIDLLKGVLYVRRSYHPAFGFGEPKSAAGRRAVHLPPDLSEMFRYEGFSKAPEDLVFTNREGKPIDPSQLVRFQFHPVMARAGLRRIRFQDLRHTYATMMIATGASPKLLQQQMGHESIETTFRHYGHLLPSASEGVGAKMETLVYKSNVIPMRAKRQE